MKADLLAAELVGVAIVFARVGTCLMLVPGIGETAVTPRVRLGLALLVALTLYPLLAQDLPRPGDDVALVRVLVGEMVIGATYGFVARLAVAALNLAGAMTALQSGLAAAALFDPQQGGQGTLPGRFLSVAGLALFLAVDAHHYVLSGLAGSYRMLPAGAPPPLDGFAEIVALATSQLWNAALRIAAPVFLVATVSYAAFGLLARLVPGIQVFFIALPLQIVLALAAFMLGTAAGLTVFLQFGEAGLRLFGW